MSQEDQNFHPHAKINFFDLPLLVIFDIVVHASQDKNNGFLQLSTQKWFRDVIQSLHLMDEHFKSQRGSCDLRQVDGLLGPQPLCPVC